MVAEALTAQIRKHWIVATVGAVLLLVVSGVQIDSGVSYAMLLVAVIVTYLVDFAFSKAGVIGNAIAALVNFFLVFALFFPFPSSILVGPVVAYLSYQEDIRVPGVPLPSITLPLAQAFMAIVVVISKVVF